MEPRVINEIRNDLGLSQAEFAQLLGVHAMTVSKWERGLGQPNAYQLALLGDFRKAAHKKKVDKELKTVLVVSGIAAAIYLLLKASRE